MTNPPGEDPTQPDQPDETEPGPAQSGGRPDSELGPGESQGQPSAGQSGYQPGYWEQQAQAQQRAQQQGQQQPPQPSYQPGYPPPYPPQAPIHYAPDHPRATTSLVMGILGVVLCQVLAPFAWVMGKRTVDEIDASYGQLGGRGAAQAGYILGIVGSVLLGLSLVFLVIYVIIMIAVIGGGIATN